MRSESSGKPIDNAGASLQIVVPGAAYVHALTSFFKMLTESGEDKYFHPHELSSKGAEEICRYSGNDFYCLVVRDGEVLAYGMLRGWDEGFAVPSLGIAVSAKYRKKGVGKMLMQYLHFVAKLRNCREVMLKAGKDNPRALSLYRSMGYVFKEHSDSMLVGKVAL